MCHPTAIDTVRYALYLCESTWEMNRDQTTKSNSAAILFERVQRPHSHVILVGNQPIANRNRPLDVESSITTPFMALLALTFMRQDALLVNPSSTSPSFPSPPAPCNNADDVDVVDPHSDSTSSAQPQHETHPPTTTLVMDTVGGDRSGHEQAAPPAESGVVSSGSQNHTITTTTGSQLSPGDAGKKTEEHALGMGTAADRREWSKVHPRAADSADESFDTDSSNDMVSETQNVQICG